MYQAPAPPPTRIPVGGIVFGVLGLAAFVISLFVPWYVTVTFTRLSFESESTDAFAFGPGSALYVVGGVLVAGFAVATLLTRGAARTAFGLLGLVATLVFTTTVLLIANRIRVATELVLAKAAEIDRTSDPDSYVSPLAGPVLAGVAVLLLVAAVVRFTWPHRPTVGYAAVSGLAVVVVLGFPWAYRKAIFPDRVLVQQYWFPHLGVPGAVSAFTAALALASVVLAVALARRAWWPPLVGLVSTIGAGVAASLVRDESVVDDARLADATFVDDTVVNSGFALVFAFVAVVTFTCALVVAIKEYRAARRPRFLPSGGSAPW